MLLSACISYSQADPRLAQQYFRDGEYEKASTLYQQLWQNNSGSDYYFDRLMDCYFALEDYDQAESLIKKQIRKTPENLRLYVTYGRLLEEQFEDDKAQIQYRKAIERLPKDRYQIIRLANAFTVLAKYDLAIETYEKGGSILRNDRVFAYNLGDLYRRKGEVEKMVTNYLNSLDDNPDRIDNLKTTFQRYFNDEEFDELKRQLYSRIEAGGNDVLNIELLAWVFIQEKNYGSALRQYKALDRRLRENGLRVFRVGQIASNAKDYDTAIQAFDYIADRKGAGSSFYLDAKLEGLRNRKLQLTQTYQYTEEQLRGLQVRYIEFLDEFGENSRTARIILDLSDLEAFYLNEYEEPIKRLEALIRFNGVDPRLQARAKIKLGDIYLVTGEIWEATLLYSQVDKAFNEDVLGHEGRFMNARLSYFTGDFQWAQAQFDILKSSTSRFIANDALDLSVFIMDNMGLDTTDQALKLYADAELLAFQNKNDGAFEKLDSLIELFPDHGLLDDVLYLKAGMLVKLQRIDEAIPLYQQIIDNYPDEIRADNALFNLAELYEEKLNAPDKAMELYEKLFIDYSSSTLAVEARKRYRTLRGDDIDS